jgi:hypothetical protein
VNTCITSKPWRQHGQFMTPGPATGAGVASSEGGVGERVRTVCRQNISSLSKSREDLASKIDSAYLANNHVMLGIVLTLGRHFL